MCKFVQAMTILFRIILFRMHIYSEVGLYTEWSVRQCPVFGPLLRRRGLQPASMLLCTVTMFLCSMKSSMGGRFIEDAWCNIETTVLNTPSNKYYNSKAHRSLLTTPRASPWKRACGLTLASALSSPSCVHWGTSYSLQLSAALSKTTLWWRAFRICYQWGCLMLCHLRLKQSEKNCSCTR